MNIEEVLSTTHRISPRERVPFHCTCCGECCRHVRQSVPLESPDVFRLTRLLREKDKGIICVDDFIARYTELALLDECGYFMLMLKVTGVDDACIFLKENLRSVSIQYYHTPAHDTPDLEYNLPMEVSLFLQTDHQMYML